jgi:ribosome biogenesis GTPase
MDSKGRVIKSTGSFYAVQNEQGIFNCRLKGNIRLKNYKFTNPVVVGDIVDFHKTEDKEGIIESIHERKNYIVRKSVNLSKQAHILAANIDLAILMATLSEPKTYPEFIDRYLVTAEAYHIPAAIIFNKVDLHDESMDEELDELFELYSALEYSCYKISANDSNSLDGVKDLFRDKTTLISGYSGVGKSTLINQLDPHLDLKTEKISEQHKSGKHATTFAEMHQIKDLGYIIDTPGIKGLGVLSIQKEELSHYFLEMRSLLPNCKFNNCVHIDEPGCAIKKALDVGEIQPSRYKSYLGIYYEDEGYR